MAIVINIDVMLAKRKMSVTELSERVGITMANISILKNGKARAVNRSTGCLRWSICWWGMDLSCCVPTW